MRRKKKRAYLAGPMSGYRHHNFPAFWAAEAALRKNWRIVSPAKKGDLTKDLSNSKKTYAEYMRRDVQMLGQCDAIILLPGWEKSRGACFELEIYLYEDL
jgi:nucleoside 2-deoxyribosyltransferase